MHDFETERLKMRLLEVSDESLYISLYTDFKTMRCISSPFQIQKACSTFKTAINLNNAEQNTQLIWCIREKPADKALGIQSLTIKGDVAEVGIILSRAAHGRGVPEESVKGLIEYGFKVLNLSVIEANSHYQNYATLRIIRKLGFKESHYSDSFTRHFRINRNGYKF
ncbi:GNAT family N-acetyltransferase [Shewanella sp. 10N.286.52.A9]|uniref:GNAT family N-acetyltransferase n=1 Tax=Shewanella sp. 10N.286.52.A9 TaxID=3229711 RepID=UPI00354E1281